MFCQRWQPSTLFINELYEQLLMRCPNCGNQASWRDPDCNKCDKTLHQKSCKGKAPDCKCHDINEQTWNQKKSSPS